MRLTPLPQFRPDSWLQDSPSGLVPALPCPSPHLGRWLRQASCHRLTPWSQPVDSCSKTGVSTGSHSRLQAWPPYEVHPKKSTELHALNKGLLPLRHTQTVLPFCMMKAEIRCDPCPRSTCLPICNPPRAFRFFILAR